MSCLITLFLLFTTYVEIGTSSSQHGKNEVVQNHVNSETLASEIFNFGQYHRSNRYVFDKYNIVFVDIDRTVNLTGNPKPIQELIKSFCEYFHDFDKQVSINLFK